MKFPRENTHFPVPLISGSATHFWVGHRSEGGVKGRLRRPSIRN